MKAYQFRNFKELDIEFNDRLNIIIGDNGQGKTNIIEAIYLLTEGESFRYSKNENLIGLGQSESAVHADIENNELLSKMSLKITRSQKKLSVNGKPLTHNKLKNFSSVLFSPESLNIIKESSDERRQLADQLVEQVTPHGYNLIRDFKKVLKTRNRLLKDISEEQIPSQMGRDTLESLNSSFLKLAAELTYLRVCTLVEMKPEVEKALNQIHSTEFGSKKVDFNFNYIISDVDHKDSDLEKIVNFLRKRMQELEIAELKSGVSLVGPQKHDIAFLYNGNDSRFYCSQGQQRSIILAYKMAQIMYHYRVHGFYPILLLDDVLSELDLTKQESLISTLNRTETQTFVTTTDITLLSKLSMDKASVFKVRDGQIIV
ncbi:MAG: DNA replication and repair protein RecF [Bdellovibrionaceae bacterium]|nr:DNA replication and repair protein RecF [Pseudobdellovibrionaceae bacterium]